MIGVKMTPSGVIVQDDHDRVAPHSRQILREELLWNLSPARAVVHLRDEDGLPFTAWRADLLTSSMELPGGLVLSMGFRIAQERDGDKRSLCGPLLRALIMEESAVVITYDHEPRLCRWLEVNPNWRQKPVLSPVEHLSGQFYALNQVRHMMPLRRDPALQAEVRPLRVQDVGDYRVTLTHEPPGEARKHYAKLLRMMAGSRASASLEANQVMSGWDNDEYVVQMVYAGELVAEWRSYRELRVAEEAYEELAAQATTYIFKELPDKGGLVQ